MTAPGVKTRKQLIRAGFSEEEISAQESLERNQAKAGGFSESEINAHFGIGVGENQERFTKFAEEALGTPEAREAKTLSEAIEAGLKSSIVGMLAREDVPDIVVTGNTSTFPRLTASAISLGLDIPFFVAGAVAGAAPGAGFLTPVTASAGAFAFHAGVRQLLVDAYTKDDVASFSEAWDRLSSAMLEAGKGYVLGGAVGTAGAVGAGAAPVIGARAARVASPAAEVVTLAKVGAALDGRVMEPHELLDAAILIGMLRFGSAATRKARDRLGKTYVETGKRPVDVAKDAVLDPSIREDLVSVNHEIPRSYKGNKADPGKEQAALKESLDLEIRAEGDPKTASGIRDFRSLKAEMERIREEAKARKEAKDRKEGKDKENVAADATQPPAQPPEKLPPPGPPESQTPREHLADRIAQNTPRERGVTFSDFLRAVVEDIYPLREALEVMRNGEDVPAVENFYTLAATEVASSAKALHFVEYGTRDFKTWERTGESLREIIDPSYNPNAPIRGKLKHAFSLRDRNINRDDIDYFMLAKRTVELNRRGIKTGAEDVPGGKTVEKAKAFIREHPELEDVQRRIVDWSQRGGLKFLKDSGMLSQKAFDLMVLMGKDYAPLERVFDAPVQLRGVSGKARQATNPIRRLIGDERPIESPLMTLMKNTYIQVQQAERNAVAKAFVEFIEKHPETGSQFAVKVKPKVRKFSLTDKERNALLDKILREEEFKPSDEQLGILDSILEHEFAMFRKDAFRPKKDHISVWRDGVREEWKVTPEIYEVFRFQESGSVNRFLDIMSRIAQAPARSLRAGAVLNIPFTVKNVNRDQLMQFIVSDSGYIPYVGYMNGIFHAMKRGERFQDWLFSGGPMSAVVSLDRNYLQQNIREIMEGTNLMGSVKNVVRHPVESMKIMTELSEYGTRIGEFDAAMKEGRLAGVPMLGKDKPKTKENILQAGFESRKALDFSRAGTMAREYNKYVSFFKVWIQGTDVLARTFKQHPIRTMLRAFTTITLPSLTFWWWNHDKDWYKETAQYIKDLAILIPIGGTPDKPDIVYAHPRPFEIGILFGAVPEHIAESMSGDPEAMKNLDDTLFRGFGGPVFPQAVLPFMESYFNWQTFADRPLIPRRLEGALPFAQSKPYTTEVSKAISNLIAHVPFVGERSAPSPITIDHFIRSWSGGGGQMILQLSDKALRAANILPDPPRPADTLADNIFLRGLVVRYPSMSSESVNRFYEKYKENEIYIKTKRILESEGDYESSFDLQNREPHRFFNVSNIKDAVDGIAAVVRQITNLPDSVMDKDEKRQTLDLLFIDRAFAARRGLQILDAIEKQKRDESRSERPKRSGRPSVSIFQEERAPTGSSPEGLRVP